MSLWKYTWLRNKRINLRLRISWEKIVFVFLSHLYSPNGIDNRLSNHRKYFTWPELPLFLPPGPIRMPILCITWPRRLCRGYTWEFPLRICHASRAWLELKAGCPRPTSNCFTRCDYQMHVPWLCLLRITTSINGCLHDYDAGHAPSWSSPHTLI